MSYTILKDLLISLGRLEDYIEGTVPVSIWRSHDTRKGGHPMDFVEKDFTLPDGRLRRADITIEPDATGAPWVRVKKLPAGLSTWDKPGVFKNKAWRYYKIPKGTLLPKGLVIVKDYYSERYGATHYTIAPAREMPLANFKQLLIGLFTQISREAV